MPLSPNPSHAPAIWRLPPTKQVAAVLRIANLQTKATPGFGVIGLLERAPQETLKCRYGPLWQSPFKKRSSRVLPFWGRWAYFSEFGESPVHNTSSYRNFHEKAETLHSWCKHLQLIILSHQELKLMFLEHSEQQMLSSSSLEAMAP